jgi:hypothetical protein
MRKYSLFLVCAFGCGLLSAQRTFQFNDYQIELVQYELLARVVDFREPVDPAQSELVQLFKQYFNPASFDQYRSFFLPQDWPGSTAADFSKWQAHLQQNQMWLEAILRVKDPHGNAFVIFQYTFESDEYVLPNSAVFKSVNGKWKHISLVNDLMATPLKQIGSLETGYLSALPREKFTIRVDDVAGQHARGSREKFNRSILFEKVQHVCQSKSMAAPDIQHARDLFIGKNEMDMVFYLADQYDMDVYALMETLNSELGFPLFRYIQTSKAK